MVDAAHKKMFGALAAGILFGVAWMGMFWVSSISSDDADDVRYVRWYWWLPLLLSTLGWFFALFIRFDRTPELYGWDEDRASTCKTFYIFIIALFLFCPFILAVLFSVSNPGMHYAAVIVLSTVLVVFSSVIFAFTSSVPVMQNNF